MTEPHAPSFLSSLVRPAESCQRSRLSPGTRIFVMLLALFALKRWLPLLGISFALQVLVLLVVGTFLAWRFWWNCSPDRRGVAILVGTLWIAGIAKILLH